MGDFGVDSKLVRKLAKLLDETGLGEIEYEADGKRIRVVRPAIAAEMLASPPAPAPTPKSSEAGDSSAKDGISETTHPGTLTSPMVGTVYLSPSPDDPPFVLPGDTVTAGQTIMLVEAMKTFNDIKAERAGRLVSILVESGQPIEYGEPLAIIE